MLHPHVVYSTLSSSSFEEGIESHPNTKVLFCNSIIVEFLPSIVLSATYHDPGGKVEILLLESRQLACIFFYFFFESLTHRLLYIM